MSTTTTPTNGALDAALQMHVAGLAIVPVYPMHDGACGCHDGTCDAPGKHPRGGRENVLDSPDDITRHWDAYPDDAVAVNVARSGLVVIDVDDADGERAVTALLAQHPPAGRCEVLTKRGRHLWFRGRAPEVTASALLGFEVKTSGIVIVPPSPHVSGATYRWADGSGPARIPNMPAALAGAIGRMVPATGGTGPTVTDLFISSTEKIAEGGRHDALVKLAGHLRAAGTGGPALDRQLQQANRTRLSPPLPDAEVRAIVKSASGWEPAPPREAPSWDDPAPLAGDPDAIEAIIPMPLDGVPDVVREHVEAVAEALQVPRDMVLLLDLGVLAVACQGMATVALGGDHVEELSLYTVTVLRSGERKSATVRECVAPVRAYERKWRTRVREQVEAHRATLRALQKRQKRAEAAMAAAASPEAMEQARTDLADAIREIAGMEPVADPRLLADDVTPEKLAALLAEQGRLGIISAEGGIVDTLAGRYSDGIPNLDVVLKAYDGEPVRVDRIGRESVEIERPLLTMSLAVQPDVMAKAAANRVLVRRGLVPRFLMSAPATLLGTRNTAPGTVPPAIRCAWDECISDLLGAAESSAPFCALDTESVEITLDPLAQAEIMRFAGEIEEGLKPGEGRWATISSTAGKAVGLAGRIAALLHLAEYRQAGLNRPISEGVMIAAVEIVTAHLHHAERMATTGGEARVIHDARAIMDWAQSVQAQDFSERLALNGARKRAGGPQDMARVRAALRLLDDRGWIRRRSTDGYERGRPPSPIWEINPGVAA